jgi:hypothetical protein
MTGKTPAGKNWKNIPVVVHIGQHRTLVQSGTCEKYQDARTEAENSSNPH